MKYGWTQDVGDLTNECTWHGVVCDANGEVKSIDLSENNLRGEIPSEVALLVKVGEYVDCLHLDEYVFGGKACSGSPSFSFVVDDIRDAKKRA